jgi:hypothetical protein
VLDFEATAASKSVPSFWSPKENQSLALGHLRYSLYEKEFRIPGDCVSK